MLARLQNSASQASRKGLLVMMRRAGIELLQIVNMCTDHRIKSQVENEFVWRVANVLVDEGGEYHEGAM